MSDRTASTIPGRRRPPVTTELSSSSISSTNSTSNYNNTNTNNNVYSSSSHSQSSSMSNTMQQQQQQQQQQSTLSQPPSTIPAAAASHNSVDFSSSFDSPLVNKVRPSSEIFLTPHRASGDYGYGGIGALAGSNTGGGIAGGFQQNSHNSLYGASGFANTMSSYGGGQQQNLSSNAYYKQQYQQPEIDQAAESWLADLQLYERTLDQMASVSLDKNFKDELSAVEQWFQMLSVGERTAALYALLQQTTPVQNKFFTTVLQQSSRDPVSSVLSPTTSIDHPQSPTLRMQPTAEQQVPTSELPSTLLKQYNQQQQQHQHNQHSGYMTPPQKDYYNAFLPKSATGGGGTQQQQQQQQSHLQQQTRPSPWTHGETIARPKSATPSQTTDQQKRFNRSSYLPDGHTSWASMVNTPASTMQSPPTSTISSSTQFPPISTPSSAATSSKLSQEIASSTAMKMAALNTVSGRVILDADVKKYRRKGSVITEEDQKVIDRELYNMHLQDLGMVMPINITPSQVVAQNNGYNSNSSSPSHSPSARKMYHSSLGVVGSNGNTPKKDPKSVTTTTTTTTNNYLDPELLEDVSAWLRMLRLHKYTDNLKDLNWRQLVQLSEEQLEDRGVNAMGARRKMLKVFEQIRKAYNV